MWIARWSPVMATRSSQKLAIILPSEGEPRIIPFLRSVMNWRWWSMRGCAAEIVYPQPMPTNFCRRCSRLLRLQESGWCDLIENMVGSGKGILFRIKMIIAYCAWGWESRGDESDGNHAGACPNGIEVKHWKNLKIPDFFLVKNSVNVIKKIPTKNARKIWSIKRGLIRPLTKSWDRIL